MADLLIINHGAVDGTITLALFGEMDLASRDLLATTLDTCVASTTGDVRLDCAELIFWTRLVSVCWCAFTKSLRATTGDHSRSGHPNIRRVFRLSGLDELLDIG